MNHGMPPTEPGGIGAGWSPMGEPLRDVPGCEAPPIEEWRVIEPRRRWLVAERAGMRVPRWPDHGSPARVRATDRARELLALEETYYSDPDDPAAYAVLVPGCSELGATDWRSALRNVVAAFHCATDRSLVLFAEHTDGLVLRATIPARRDGAPECSGLLLMASLVPLRSDFRPCRGGCAFYEGLLRSDDDATVFDDAAHRSGISHIREVFEVVPVGSDRFEVSLFFEATPRRREPSLERAPLTFLGSKLDGHQTRDGERTVRTATIALHPHGRSREPPSWVLGVEVVGPAGAFERGLRFVEGLAPGGELQRFELVAQREKRVVGRPKVRSRAWFTVERAVLVALLVAAPIAWALARARRRR